MEGACKMSKEEGIPENKTVMPILQVRPSFDHNQVIKMFIYEGND
jgi:hypothetical protein